MKYIRYFTLISYCVTTHLNCFDKTKRTIITLKRLVENIYVASSAKTCLMEEQISYALDRRRAFRAASDQDLRYL